MHKVDFSNTQKAFEYRTDWELRKAKLLFSSLKSPVLINSGARILFALKKVYLSPNWLIKSLIYNHFCGGVRLEEAQKVANTLGKYHVFSIPDYSVEGKTTDAGIESMIKETTRTMAFAASDSNFAFSVFKPSALAPSSILEKMSNGSALNSEEKKLADLFHHRFEHLCEQAVHYNVKLLIDAEEYCCQEIIDKKTEEMMYKYNKSKVIIFNTLQMYRHDREKYLEALIERAKLGKFKVGLKLVRGAYLEKENEKALQKGYPTPIYATKEETDRSFNKATKTMIENLEICELFLGTHNQESIELLIELMQQKGIVPNDLRIFFGQLYGMSDNLTFNLAANNYNAAKYLPYGPVKETIPYLIRRATENLSLGGQTGRELTLIRQEQVRRNSINKPT